MKKTAIKDVDAYIAAQPKNVAAKLKQLRQTVRSAAPEAQEIISYGMPAYKYHGRLVYFGAFKNHISFYPRPSGSTTFQKELSQYKGAKGTVKLPLDKPLPLGLIRKIVKFKAKANLKKQKEK